MHVVSAVCRLLFFLAVVFVFVDVDVGEGGVDVVAVTLLPCLRVPIKRISPRYRYEWLVASFSIQCFIPMRLLRTDLEIVFCLTKHLLVPFPFS